MEGRYGNVDIGTRTHPKVSLMAKLRYLGIYVSILLAI